MFTVYKILNQSFLWKWFELQENCFQCTKLVKSYMFLVFAKVCYKYINFKQSVVYCRNANSIVYKIVYTIYILLEQSYL